LPVQVETAFNNVFKPNVWRALCHLLRLNNIADALCAVAKLDVFPLTHHNPAPSGLL